MSLSLVLLTLKQKKPNAKYVIWPRIDQKTCLKCIPCAGLEIVCIENLFEGDEVRTNVVEIKRMIEKLGKDSILCVLSTTSCFAPRAPDRYILTKKSKTIYFIYLYYIIYLFIVIFYFILFYLF
jgi:O-phospho-L-seryl-tRNASec:L-selenocysteinyl-tRNA synthase